MNCEQCFKEIKGVGFCDNKCWDKWLLTHNGNKED